MGRRGPRGDLSRDVILKAADELVVEHGDVARVSLRGVAAALGVTANALYTYVESREQILHDLADERLGRLRPEELLRLAEECRHCALLELFRRATTLYTTPGTLPLLKAQPTLGPHSFRLSETVMQLCEGGLLEPRDAHDLVMGWFYGSASLDAEGWTAGTDTLRASPDVSSVFPRVGQRPDPDRAAQFAAILRGIGIEHQP